MEVVSLGGVDRLESSMSCLLKTNCEIRGVFQETRDYVSVIVAQFIVFSQILFSLLDRLPSHITEYVQEASHDEGVEPVLHCLGHVEDEFCVQQSRRFDHLKLLILSCREPKFRRIVR